MAIYLDHNAGAPLRPQAAAALSLFIADAGGNPASVHRAGQRARRMLEDARVRIAALVGASPRQIVFTSGGTESNNLAIFGAAMNASLRSKVVSSAIEHSSAREPLGDLERRGMEIVRLTPDSDGKIASSSVIEAIDSTTSLVTLGMANSEVGTLQDFEGIAERARSAGALFHVDAAQAAGRVPVDVDAIGCDLVTISGHKFGAPAGIGALYVRDAARIAPLMHGGPHERGLRAGTPNLAGAIAMGAAAKAAGDALAVEASRIGTLSGLLLSRLRAGIPGLGLNGPEFGRIPNTLNLTFPGVLGESLLIALDLEGVEVSMGSACAAGSVEPSHVLRAMGKSAAQARSSLRISLGWNTTAAEIDAAADIIARVWRRVAATEPVTSQHAAGAAP
ncbi:MAG TPA: cysteine desulfurase family protein [Candidatus Binataceae bacterium]|nr:cysteine desulfurase family protein [Candidatus Binataceae bacterium]